MLEVGTDTYITIAEADRLLAANVADATAWMDLNNEKKEQQLRNAVYRIDTLPYASYKMSLHQPMQFPRGLSRVVPERVKLAQALEAYAALDVQANARRQLRDQGVTSVTLGSAAESYDRSRIMHTGTLLSVDAYRLLWPYLLGSAVMV